MPLKIMFWNIQNLGETRTGRDEVLKEVCRLIKSEDADIVCIQELQVTAIHQAQTIIASINRRLKTIQYEYILCPHNGFERYLYLYKASNTLKAIVLDEQGLSHVDSQTILNQNFSETQSSTVSATRGSTGMRKFFPLFNYDGIGAAARPPGIGLFRYTDTNNYTHNLAIFNWHNDAANQGFIESNVGRLMMTQLVRDGKFNAQVNGSGLEFNSIIIGGDFNFNMNKTDIRPYAAQIPNRTHLHVFNTENDNKFNTSADTRDRSFDNIITRLSGGLQAIGATCDLPEYYMVNKTGATQYRLGKSNLITQTIEAKNTVKRLKSKFKSNGKKPKISKTAIFFFSGLLKNVNLYTISDNDMRTGINGLGISRKDKATISKTTFEFIDREVATNRRWNARIANMNGLIYNDTLFLTRHWASDHLPIYITLNP